MLKLLAVYIIHLIATTKYFGIFILMVLESALIPIPSEITMPFSGFLVHTGQLSFFWVITTGTAANLIGSLILYYLGVLLEETFIINFISKYGKFILVRKKDYDHARHWFEKYGDKIIFISRLLPGLRTVISLPAGVFEMNVKKFITYTATGCFIWSVALTYTGFILGEKWNSLEKYFRVFEIGVIGIITIFVVYYILKKLKNRKSSI